MIKSIIAIACLALSACASNDYSTYVEAQRSVSKDLTMNETARVAALVEMTKSSDASVRAVGIMLLQQLQAGSKQVVIDPPKKNWLGF